MRSARLNPRRLASWSVSHSMKITMSAISTMSTTICHQATRVHTPCTTEAENAEYTIIMTENLSSHLVVGFFANPPTQRRVSWPSTKGRNS